VQARSIATVDIDTLRPQTPGCAGRIHLNNAGAALLAQPTLDAMIAQLRREAPRRTHEGTRPLTTTGNPRIMQHAKDRAGPATLRKCHEFETDRGDIAVRQPRKPRSRKINMSPDLRPSSRVAASSPQPKWTSATVSAWRAGEKRRASP
jgi:hypothetical protein